MKHADTSFIADLLRGKPEARALLDRLGNERIAVSPHVACELSAGVELSNRGSRERKKVERLLSSLEVLDLHPAFIGCYGKVFARLERAGQRVPSMDLLIATSAIAGQAELITRNAKDFERIPGLSVVTY